MTLESGNRKLWHHLHVLHEEVRHAAGQGDCNAAYVADWMEEIFAACVVGPLITDMADTPLLPQSMVRCPQGVS